MLAKTARSGVDEVTKVIASVRALVEEVDGLRNTFLDFGGKKIPLEEPEKVVEAIRSASS